MPFFNGIWYNESTMNKRVLKILIIILLVGLLIPFIINLYVINKTNSHIYKLEGIASSYEYALVLGCGLQKDGSPSKMLKDRLDEAILLYEKKIIKKIIISGDDRKDYSEVSAMEKYLLKEKIPEDIIIRDNEGQNTSQSILNFNKNYSQEKVIIITQKYHLYRALYSALKLNIDAIGVSAKDIRYNGQLIRDLREILARCKDFVLTNFW